MGDYKTVIAVDFDGVLHLYRSKWTGYLEINDGPVTPEARTASGHAAGDAIQWLKRMLRAEDVIVTLYTCRTNSTEPTWAKGGEPNPRDREAAADAIRAWLLKHGLTEEEVAKVRFSIDHKPNASVYIDDRAYEFRGRFPKLSEIKRFKPWNHQESSLSNDAIRETLVHLFSEGFSYDELKHLVLDDLHRAEVIYKSRQDEDD